MKLLYLEGETVMATERILVNVGGINFLARTDDDSEGIIAHARKDGFSEKWEIVEETLTSLGTRMKSLFASLSEAAGDHAVPESVRMELGFGFNAKSGGPLKVFVDAGVEASIRFTVTWHVREGG